MADLRSQLVASSHDNVRSAYIHVPFCAHRCGYCDFTLVARKDHLIDDYLRALEIELSSVSQPKKLNTLFFGGGTPTHLSAGKLDELLELAFRRFSLEEGAEFSVEANPAGLDDDKIRVLADAGVNRLSLGVQSFTTPLLELLERDHRRVDVIETVERLRSRFDNISFDLIFGVPGQTETAWRETLQQAIALQPEHISTYGLTFEKGTSFWTRLQKGALTPVTEDTERQMYADAMDLLQEAGFEQYEISSFSRPGYRCRHNEVYWTGLSYYGFGPGAARYLHGRRETNHRSVTTWIKRVLVGESAVGDAEELTEEERARELLVLGLRRCQGVQHKEFHKRTGFHIDELAREAIAKHSATGLLENTQTSLRLTRGGRFLADTVIVDLL